MNMWHRLYARGLWPICVKQIGLWRGAWAKTTQKFLFLSESWKTKTSLSNGKCGPTQQHRQRFSKTGLFGEPLLGWHAVDGKQEVYGKGREIGKHITHGGIRESEDIGNNSEGISGNRVSVWSANIPPRGLPVCVRGIPVAGLCGWAKHVENFTCTPISTHRSWKTKADQWNSHCKRQTGFRNVECAWRFSWERSHFDKNSRAEFLMRLKQEMKNQHHFSWQKSGIWKIFKTQNQRVTWKWEGGWVSVSTPPLVTGGG